MTIEDRTRRILIVALQASSCRDRGITARNQWRIKPDSSVTTTTRAAIPSRSRTASPRTENGVPPTPTQQAGNTTTPSLKKAKTVYI